MAGFHSHLSAGYHLSSLIADRARGREGGRASGEEVALDRLDRREQVAIRLFAGGL